MFRYIILIAISALAFAENSADTFGNGVYDYAEILTVDHNGNGVWDDIVEEVLGDNPNTFEVENDFILVEAVPADEFIDVDGDLVWDVAEEFTDVNANGVWDDVILGDDPATIDIETDFVLVPAEPWVDANNGVNDYLVNPDYCWYEEWYIPIEDYYEIFEGDNLTLDATPEHLVYLHLHPIFINEDFDGDGTLDISEDLNQNGILDSGEDIDGDGFLDIDEDIDGDNNLDLNTEIFVDQNTNTVYLKNGLSDQDILEFDINDHYSIEPFVDVGNGVYDEGEEFIDTLNGVYDEGEEFVDVANGIYDEGETFTDALNGVYDVGESFIDSNRKTEIFDVISFYEPSNDEYSLSVESVIDQIYTYIVNENIYRNALEVEISYSDIQIEQIYNDSLNAEFELQDAQTLFDYYTALADISNIDLTSAQGDVNEAENLVDTILDNSPFIDPSDPATHTTQYTEAVAERDAAYVDLATETEINDLSHNEMNDAAIDLDSAQMIAWSLQDQLAEAESYGLLLSNDDTNAPKGALQRTDYRLQEAENLLHIIHSEFNEHNSVLDAEMEILYDYLGNNEAEILASEDNLALAQAELDVASADKEAAVLIETEATVAQGAAAADLNEAQNVVDVILDNSPFIDPADPATWTTAYENAVEVRDDAALALSDAQATLLTATADANLARNAHTNAEDEYDAAYEQLNADLARNQALTNEEVLIAVNAVNPDDDGFSEPFNATLSAKNPYDFSEYALQSSNDPSSQQFSDFLISFRNSLNSRTSLITTAQKEEILNLLPNSEGNGVYDEGEEFIDTLNGVYDEGEEFVDVANGVWDDAILDENGNILIPAEEFTDTLNGVYDEGESFVDLGNGVYDEGEPFTDSNGNGEWDEIIQEWWIWPPGDNPPGPPEIVPPGPPEIGPPEIGPPIIIPPDAERFTYQWYYPIPGDPIGFPIPAEFGGTNARYNIQGIKANEGNWRVEVTDHQPENWFIIYDDDTLVFDFNRYTDILEDNEVSRDWIPGIGWSITRSRSFEVRVVKDSDNDGLYDYVETDTGEYVSPTNTGTNPYNSDTDFDTLSDGYEITIGTNPNLFDTDSDGLSDYAETNTGEFISAEDTGTNPLAYDTSGDGLNDGEVVGVGFDPNVNYTPLLNLSSINMTQEVKDLRPGSVTIQVIDGEANINMDIESSTDLENWEIDSAITVPMQIEEGEATKFFRFKMAE